MKVIKIGDINYPKRLLDIKNPPKQLYVIGNEKLLNNNSIAIVGSRRCSEYGIKHAKEFTKAIADRNITIISGLAIGIDSVAHDVAKECRGGTIAVLGCGLNHIYPHENKQLYYNIIEKNGCIISEYEPNIEVDTKNFPKRNRIISGMSNGVLVIEAGVKSGSTITGRYGLEQQKKVFCLPRDIDISKGIGTNELIKKGAKLVTTPNDILKEYGIEYNQKRNIIRTKVINNSIPPEYQDIYNFVSYIPQNIQYLSKKSGLKIAQVTQKLIMLELQGYIKSMPGNYYVRK